MLAEREIEMKKFNWLLFIILLLVFFPAAIVYLIYFLVKNS